MKAIAVSVRLWIYLCALNIPTSSMLDIVMINNEFMHKITKCLVQYSSELSGQHYVSVVLKYYLTADALYILGHVVDHECDTLVESIVVHSLFVE